MNRSNIKFAADLDRRIMALERVRDYLNELGKESVSKNQAVKDRFINLFTGCGNLDAEGKNIVLAAAIVAGIESLNDVIKNIEEKIEKLD